MSEEDLWPVEPSEAVVDALADPVLPVELFSKVFALTVAIAEDPWLKDSSVAVQGGHWRTVPIPDGGGIVEYLIIEAEHRVILTRIFPF
ncbi:hypothetical protein [Streptomyces sp. RKAG337]|uniref:hypothetical protein n=1 Tax=Streptomyces sp. RKAG337 TaxID=2893404 RepID=UPI002034812C|nr:hypothetical protein [Streptomyces sp. RKAG337]MCM2426665.1 hypothetical protein [Streptomyces sp. RKAG337]